jgi:PAS domain S-box-containing protein
MIDISERQRAERALRESEEKYRDIFEKAVEGIFQSTPDGRFLSVNPAFAHTLGYESGEELLASVANIGGQMYVDPAERQRFIDALEASDRVLAFEHELVRKDGTTIWVSVNARRKTGPDGKTLYYEGTTENITERRQAEEERARLQLQLRQSQKMEAIGTLAGGVAHDFNNILTVLTGYGTLLQMRMDKSNALRMYVDQIMAASMKAANLTQSLLAFSRQQPIALSPMDLNETIRGTEKLLKRLLTEDIVLKTVLTAQSLMVMADRTQIDQILFNLATNARDAMPKGGTLTIETGLVELDKDALEAHGCTEPGRFFLLSVADTGIGMDDVTKEKAFEPFFTTKEVGKGTGLGLATVYGIVKQHNGQIAVSSERDHGTTFRIYLPLAKVAEEKERMRRKRIKKGNETILVAEDNEAVRGLMREMLNTHGYTVVEAADGKEAIDRFRKNKDIQLLLLDSVMPKKNGREVYDAINAIRPDVRVVFTSGYTRDIVLDKGIEDKTFDFISKPIVKDKLLEKVREVLDRV